jgi:uncharacterized protein involved in type VI secretion and phage assembly
MMNAADPTAATAAITIHIAGADSNAHVIELNGREGLNEFFDYSVQLCTTGTEIDLNAVLKSSCTISIDAGGSTRYIHGIVIGFERLGEQGQYTYYTARLAPLHWMLTKRYGSRIFQAHNCPDMTAGGIIRKVLLDAGVPQDMFRFALSAALTPREYVVQYRETEYAFIARLMEDEGLACYFEHTQVGHTLVIGDAPGLFGNNPIYSNVTYSDPNGMDAGMECVYRVRERRSVEYGAIGLTDYDFKRPGLDLRTRYAGGALPPRRYSTKIVPPPPKPYSPPSTEYGEPPQYGGSSGDGYGASGESSGYAGDGGYSGQGYGGGAGQPGTPVYGGSNGESSYGGNSSGGAGYGGNSGGSGYGAKSGGSGYGAGSGGAVYGGKSTGSGYGGKPGGSNYGGNSRGSGYDGNAGGSEYSGGSAGFGYGGNSGGSGYDGNRGGSGYAGGSGDSSYAQPPTQPDAPEYGHREREYGGGADVYHPNTPKPPYNQYPTPPKPPHTPYIPPLPPPHLPPPPPIDYGCAEVKVDYPGAYSERDDGSRRAKLRLEEHQGCVRVYDLHANLRGLMAGYRFALQYHPVEAFNAEYLVTELVLHAKQSQGCEEDADYDGGFRFEAQVRAIPADVPYRPPCRTPHPHVRGAQTALVVGPTSDEIYTDAYGRVKVQFHWDAEGVYDEWSSCWIRVSHGMAGGQYGMMFIPRVGQEVIVDFLEGSPDRPIITGRVFNGDCMPPYKLPDYKTRSCIRTQSTHGGGGANEIRFEDSKDYEHLLVYAQRDYHLRSRANCFQAVGGDNHAWIYGNHYEKVAKKSNIEVCLDRKEKIGGNQSLTVCGDMNEGIQGKHGEHCAEYSLKAESGEVVIEAATGITLKVGGNFIKIDAAGVHVVGTIINLNGGGSAGVGYWRKPEWPYGPKKAYGDEYGYDMRYSCTPTPPAHGGLEAPRYTPPHPEKPEQPTYWVEIELVDEAGKPWPAEEYEITAPDGDVYRGTLDANGQAHVAVKTAGACQIRFPKLDMAAWERN